MKLYRFFAGICLGPMLAALLAGCSDQLEIVQNGATSQDSYYQNDQEAESAVSTVYCFWRACYETRMTLLETLTDDVSKGGMNVNFFSTWKDRNTYIFNSGNEGIATYYTNAYTLIYYCNLIIEKVPGTTDVQKRCIAEAKFFRAWTHFHLGALWGENVPVVDHLLHADEYHVTNSPNGALWALVEQDLTDAIAVLPSKNGVSDQRQTRVTREAAEVVLGKAYMWQQKYNEAAIEFDKVVESGLYDLWEGDYDLLMHVQANQCCEKVLDAMIPNDQANYKVNSLDRVNAWWGYFGWSGRMMKFSPQANEIFASGENYLAPRKELYDAFVLEQEAYADAASEKNRFKSTLRTVWELAEIGAQVTSDMPDHDLYFNWKNRELKADLMGTPGGRGADNQYMNMPYIRYAEVLLLGAEAQLKASNGSQQKADAYLNKVRSRAGLLPKTATLDAIKLEKRLELCFEGVRYLDLIRWQRVDGTHDAFLALKDQGKESYNLKADKNGDTYTYSRVVSGTNPSAGFKEGKNELLPIPQAEIEVNGDYIQQNPNW